MALERVRYSCNPDCTHTDAEGRLQLLGPLLVEEEEGTERNCFTCGLKLDRQVASPLTQMVGHPGHSSMVLFGELLSQG